MAQDGGLGALAKGSKQLLHHVFGEVARDLADEQLDCRVVVVCKLDHHGRAAAVKGGAVVKGGDGLLCKLHAAQGDKGAAFLFFFLGWWER